MLPRSGRITGSSCSHTCSTATPPFRTTARYELPLLPPSLSGSLTRDQKSWTFARGALATVDRPVFGWIGVFFWNNVSVSAGFLLFFTDLSLNDPRQIAHNHVAHHFFVTIPFCKRSRSRSRECTRD